MDIQCIAENGECFCTSHFACLNVEEIKNTSNIFLDSVVSEFAKHAENNPYVYLTANHLLLTMLQAIDQDAKNRELLLQSAYNLSEWLLQTPDELIHQTISIVNKLQVIKRTRVLTEEESNKLCQMIDENPSDKEFLFCAYILLDAYGIAKKILKQLEPKFQEAVADMPIYYFMTQKQS